MSKSTIKILCDPTVPWDRWDCPWESTVPPEGPRIPLSILSHCTIGQVGLSMRVLCPSLGAPYPTVRPISLYHGTRGTVHSPLSLRPIPLYHGTSGTIHVNPLSYLSHIMCYSCPTQFQIIQCIMVAHLFQNCRLKKCVACIFRIDLVVHKISLVKKKKTW